MPWEESLSFFQATITTFVSTLPLPSIVFCGVPQAGKCQRNSVHLYMFEYLLYVWSVNSVWVHVIWGSFSYKMCKNGGAYFNNFQTLWVKTALWYEGWDLSTSHFNKRQLASLAPPKTQSKLRNSKSPIYSSATGESPAAICISMIENIGFDLDIHRGTSNLMLYLFWWDVRHHLADALC